MSYIIEIAVLVIAAIALVGVAIQKKSKPKETPTRPGQRQEPTEPEPPEPETTEPAQAKLTSQTVGPPALKSEPFEQLAEAERALPEQIEKPEASTSVSSAKPEEPEQTEPHLLEQTCEPEPLAPEQAEQADMPTISVPEQLAQPEAPQSLPLAEPEDPKQTQSYPLEQTDEPESQPPELPEQPEAPQSVPLAESEDPKQTRSFPLEQTDEPESLPPELPEQPEAPQSVPLAESEDPKQTEPYLLEQTDEPGISVPEPPEGPSSVALPESEDPAQTESHLPEQIEELLPLVLDQPKRLEDPQPAETSDGSVPSRIDQVARYVPSIRTPETTKRRPASQRTATSGARHRPIVLPIFVRIVFGRRSSTVQASLLPARNGGLEEEIQVNGPDGEETWLASQDEWYGDSVRSDIERCLANGMRWTSGQASWVLSPRDLYVLAPNSTIFGFVSVTRLLLNENQLVLCREGIQEGVREELQKAGCDAFERITGRGVPDGWVLFSEVRPTTAIAHDESAGIFNVLRPIGEVEVYLQGGIRLSHNKWLLGHPPRIRVRGNSGDAPVVSIDGEAASVAENGSYRTPGAFTLGQHVVFCEGTTTPFAIVEGQNEWDLFVAYEYSIGRTRKTEISICGPTVMGHGEQTLVPTTNRCLLGAQPGEVYFCEPAYDQAANVLLAVTDFPVAWALPDNPYQCNKTKTFAKSTANIAVGAVRPHLGVRPSYQLLQWCNAILNSSRKGLRTDPADKSVAELWSDYVRAARQLKRSMR